MFLFGDDLMYIPCMGRPRGSKNVYSGRDRFPTCYEVDQQTGCWNWIKSRGSHGYGDFRRDDHKLAHRWSYATFVGPIPEDGWVLHRCDNRRCVNPEHLFLGDADANSKDMSAKGRVYSKGKTFEEVFGEEQAVKMKRRLAEKAAALHTGKKRSNETRIKLSEALKAAHARKPNWRERTD